MTQVQGLSGQPVIVHREAQAPANVRHADVCSGCLLSRMCLICGLTPQELHDIENRLVFTRRRVARGERLFSQHEPFEAVYAIRTGFFKTSASTRQGGSQVLGFHMGGDLLGLDGLAHQHHTVEAVALEDSQVCVIREAALDTLAREVHSLSRQIYRAMSMDVEHCRDAMLRMGSMHAEERIAHFLLDLTQRLKDRGYSPTSLVLRMTREDIGSYLGMKVETVSRSFTKLQTSGLVDVQHRHLMITDPEGLAALAKG